MTYRVDIAEAPARLLDLIRAAEQGEEVIITKNQQPVVQLVAVLSGQPRPQFGSARGKVHMRDDFDAPLDEFREYMA
ncbi:MAG: type II toxin-antitoxin system Phd/YefM family antitoxin [Chloroflexales bacterium]|nr:type II toxin-antitoxin system Phd/YefM family antitoxin [Chloroflexales bacterium]